MPHWCAYPHFGISVQDGRLEGNSGFPILKIWEPFRSQISIPNHLTWSCPCIYITLYALLMQVASFWNSSPRMADWQEIRDFPYLTYGNHSAVRSQYSITWPGHDHAWTWPYMSHWCRSCHFEFRIQDGRLAGNSGFPILNIWEPFRGQISVLNDLTWTCPCMKMALYVPLMQVDLILNFRSKMANWREIRDFPY